VISTHISSQHGFKEEQSHGAGWKAETHCWMLLALPHQVALPREFFGD
jgi:hypothetical protein